jgi:uncharacterized protein YheU (UPF0270 family)
MLGRMAEYIVVPPSALSEEALHGLVEEFITREGTDYGHQEHSLESKRAAVLLQVKRGQAVILFDRDTEATTIVRREELTQLG